MGVVHRDLKPANILVSDTGIPMLLDFNLSQDLVPGGRCCLLVGGTLPYLSAEHLRAVHVGENVGPQSDIFSLGAILYQWITGKLPYPTRIGPFDDVI